MTENLWTFKTRNFTIRLDALPEHDPDLSFDDTAETARSLEAGRAAAFCARAQALDRKGRVLAEDYLGNCIYRSMHEFISTHRDPDPFNRNSSIMRKKRGPRAVICHYFPDMIRTVCRDARTVLRTHAALYIRASA